MGGLRVILTVVTLIMLALWTMAPSLASRYPSVQELVWIPEWLWLIAMLPGTMVLILISIGSSSRKRGVCWSLAGLVPVLIVAGGVWKREWRPDRPGGAGDLGRVVFLNAQDPGSEESGGILDAIDDCRADLVIVVNPGQSLASIWRSRIQQEQEQEQEREGVGSLASGAAAEWSILWLSQVLVASPHGKVSLRTVSVREGVRVMRVRPSETVAEAIGLSDILVVDLPSDPTLDRTEILASLSALLEKQREENGLRADLVVGDFNTTPRTVGLEEVWPGMSDVYPGSGSGWGATWPRERPMIRIDMALTPEHVAVRRLSTFAPGDGGHRGLVIEIDP